jgi:Asp-tRNA(Asn)/Glu-tRNA(Gln) amidotransferase B subunit
LKFFAIEISKDGEKKALNSLVGAVMKKTKGRADARWRGRY